MHSPFHSRRASCHNRSKPKGPVRRNTISGEVAAPTYKRGFVTPKFWGTVRLHCSLMVMGVVGHICKDCRTTPDVFLTTMLHSLRVEMQTVVFLCFPEEPRP